MSENPAGRRDDPCDRGRCATDWVPATARKERRISMEPCCGQIVRGAVPRGLSTQATDVPLQMCRRARCEKQRRHERSCGPPPQRDTYKTAVTPSPSRPRSQGRSIHDFRAIYSVCAYLDQLSVDWQSKELSDARRSATINAKNSY